MTPNHSKAESERAAHAAWKSAAGHAKRAEAAAKKGDARKAIMHAMEAAYKYGEGDTYAHVAGMKRPNAYGWGAFVGSLAGGALGSLLGLPGMVVGSMAGGYYGGKHGLPSMRPSETGAQWGAVGGALGPIGAGLAARFATRAGKSPNPAARMRALKK